MHELLKKYFGYDNFRPSQQDIINNVVNNRDTLVLMPTGGGKSLCYQVPALKFKGLTIVISPLISLMKDQVDSLKLNGIGAEYISSSLSKNVIDDILKRIKNGEVKILYVTPERLALRSFKLFLCDIEVSLIAIDEAHCISQWGHDFRRDYRNLKDLKNIFGNIPIIALTATATKEVKKDILNQLNLDNPKIFTSSFNRENLKIIIRDKKNSFAQILCLLEKNKNESVIIYCHSRNDTKILQSSLRKYGFQSVIYHAGLSQNTREKNQDLFIKDKVNIIIATIAFGMGIDKPNVRLVIHNTFSKSIEGYYQEIGRAGRDSLPSNCVLFYSKDDKKKHEFLINRGTTSTQKHSNILKLNKMIEFCETTICRKRYLLEYFSQSLEDDCGNCDNCLKLNSFNDSLEDFKANKIRILNKNTLKYDKAFFSELKNLRTKIALREDIQPTMILGDVSLKEIASKFPKTEKDFLDINGISQKKLDDFGEDFLMLVNEYLEINNIENSIKIRKSNEVKGEFEDENHIKRKYVKKRKYKKTSKKRY